MTTINQINDSLFSEYTKSLSLIQATHPPPTLIGSRLTPNPEPRTPNPEPRPPNPEARTLTPDP
jgi:hypothetical protein